MAGAIESGALTQFHRTQFFVFGFILAFCLASEAKADVLSLRHDTFTFIADADRDSVFTLPVRWAELDSIHVFRNGTELAQFTQWRVLDPGNRIWIFSPPAPGDSLRIEYAYRPIPIYRTYARRSVRETQRVSEEKDSLVVVPATPVEESITEGWSRLNKSGSLLRSVQVGTDSDLELESALNLQIEGRVGRDIDVVAALTDQTTPIQPEGTTESINELEKVFVSVRSPHWAATLGDYTLELGGAQYDNYQRKLTGALGELTVANSSAVVSGAVNDGEFFSNSFIGAESVQGPYPLRGRNGETGIVVLAGTETVWLDGVQMRRGEGNDYVIDYAAGEITFTARRIITSESRIVVDFEYSNEDFQRTYGAARFQQGIHGNRVSGAATWIIESDDRSRPINRTIDNEEEEILRAAGDDPNNAVISSADSVGSGAGDYIRQDTTTIDSVYSIFVYSPRDSMNQSTGTWQVLFDDFGIGNGDYEAAADSLGTTFFRWVGPGLGRYRPFKRLPLPEQHSLADIRLSTIPISGLSFGGELALSQLDRNTYSSFDDSENNGAAMAGNANFGKINPTIFGIQPYRIDLNASLRARNKDFREITRSSEIEFNREWDVAANTGSGELIFESSAGIAPIRTLTLQGGFGTLDRESVQQTDRYSASARFDPSPLFRSSLSHLQIFSNDSALSRSGNWIRQRGTAASSFGRFSPRTTIDHERKRDNTRLGLSGFRFLDYRAGLGVALPSDFSLDGEFARRVDERLDNSNQFLDSSRAYTATGEAAWRPQGGGWTLLRFAHREKEFAGADSGKIVTDVGRLESFIAPRNRLVESNVTYEVSKTRSQNQILVAVQVTPGTGTYRREGESFVPDDQGDYILVTRNSGEYEPATELNFNTILWLRPDELSDHSFAPWLHALSTETELTIEERTRLSLSPDLLLLNPSQFRGDSTLSGSVSYRQDLHVNRLSRRISLRLRYRYSNNLDNQLLNSGQERSRQDVSARVRAQYTARLRGETEGGITHEVLDYSAGTLPSRDIDRSFIIQETTFSATEHWEIGLKLAAEEAQDDRTQTQMSLRQFAPRAAYKLLSRGRVDGDVAWIHVSSNRAIVPFELGNGSNRGENFRWNLRGTYQFAQNFSGSLNYTGRQDSGEKTFHTGRVEVRATF